MSHRDADSQLRAAAAAQLDVFLALLMQWNARINLTAVRNAESIVRRHFAESLFAAGHVPAGTATLLDFGSGAGFPGIPIGIARPEVAVTLAESQGKKAAFLREAVRTLGLRAEVWAGRVEEMPKERVFDAVTLRAVDKMPQACRFAVPRVAAGAGLGSLPRGRRSLPLMGWPRSAGPRRSPFRALGRRSCGRACATNVYCLSRPETAQWGGVPGSKLRPGSM